MRPLILAFFLLLTIRPPLHAQEINVGDILLGGGDEFTNTLLNMVFGPLWEGENDKTLISILIADFNVLFFAIGALLLSYNMITGVMETAHEGEILGRRHSTLWVPIRLLVAGALLIPMPATGYNGSQYLISYVVNVGTGISTFFWQKTVNLLIHDHMPIVGTDFEAKDGQFVQNVWRMEICRAVYNYEVSLGGGTLSGVQKHWRSLRDGSKELSYDMTGYRGACGTITLPSQTAGFDRIASAAGKSYADFTNDMQRAVQDLTNRIAPTADHVAVAVSRRAPLPQYRDLAADLKSWRTAHAAILKAYISTEKLQKATKEAAEKPEPLKLNTVGSIRDTNLAESLKSGGWLKAGFYYMLLSRFSADASAIASNLPTTTSGGAIGASSNPKGRTMSAISTQYGAANWYFLGSAGGDAAKFLEQIAATYNGTVEWWNESVARSGIRAFTNQRTVFADNASDISSYMPSAGNMVKILNFLDPEMGTQDPMIGLITFGNQIAFWVSVTIIVLTGLAAFPIGGQAIIAFAGFMGWILSSMAVGGFSLAFILPMMPTVIWIVGVTAFFLLVVEAIFAGPLWALAHLSMDGVGMGGEQARRGYVFVLALLLTPVLMLFGLLVGMIIFRVSGMLINQGFYYAFTSLQAITGDGITQLTWLIGMFVIMVFMIMTYVVVIERSFALIAEFPSRVFRWFDERAASDLDTNAAARANTAAAATGAAIDRGSGAAGRGLAGRAKEIRSGKEKKDEKGKK